MEAGAEERREGEGALSAFTDIITDASRQQIASYRYRAFGEQMVTYGSSPSRFTWVGKLGYYHQPDTEDYWLRARVYRPQMGRS